MAANLAADRRIATTRAGVRDTAWLDAQPGAEEQPTAERALLGRERLARIEAALAAMPPRMSAALRQYRVEGVPQKQIAERLGMTVSGIEKLLRRAAKEIHLHEVAEEAESIDPHRLSGEGDTASWHLKPPLSSIAPSTGICARPIWTMPTGARSSHGWRPIPPMHRHSTRSRSTCRCWPNIASSIRLR